MLPTLNSRLVRSFLLLTGGVLCVCTAFAVADTLRWPLVGDASLIHYICFLMDHGMAPYHDLGDMNMPGSFMVEWTIMHTLGMGALAWRVFDLLLMTAAAAAIFVIAHPYSRFASVFAATLFYLVHQRDGLSQGGQRDLTMAVALLIATAALLHALRSDRRWPIVLFGLTGGIATTIKPTALLFAAGLCALAVYTLRHRHAPVARPVFLTLFTAAIPLIAALLFLLRHAAFHAFLIGLRTVVPYYASLGHRPIGYLLTHSISPLLPLVLIWLALIASAKPPLTLERIALLGGSLFGLISYVVQARGFPYYRYPLLAFLLPLMAIDFTVALRQSTRKIPRLLAAIAIVTGAFVIAPGSAWSIHRYDPTNLDFISALESTLNRLGGPRLSGHVQCIDSISGCGTTLYRMRLVQSTGVLSDFLLFGPPDKPVIRDTRAAFLSKITAAPPSVIVVSSPLHIDGPGNYAKLDLWPDFRDLLATHYCLYQDWSPTRYQRWWSRPQMPAGFRVYILANPNRPFRTLDPCAAFQSSSAPPVLTQAPWLRADLPLRPPASQPTPRLCSTFIFNRGRQHFLRLAQQCSRVQHMRVNRKLSPSRRQSPVRHPRQLSVKHRQIYLVVQPERPVIEVCRSHHVHNPLIVISLAWITTGPYS